MHIVSMVHLYIYWIMVREIWRFILPRKNHVSRGHRPNNIWIFCGNISSYFPEHSAMFFLLFQTTKNASSSNIFFSSFKKHKHRECFIFYVIFLHFFSFVNTNYRQLNCFPYLNKTLIIIFFFRFNHICLHCRLISIFPLHWNEKSQST